MLLYILATCFIVLSSGFKVSKFRDVKDLPKLEWPPEYKVKATHVHLTSGLVEDYNAWKTNSSSRVDYNQGAVKRITLMSKSLEDGDKYEIHPETKGEEYNKISCYEIGSSSSVPVKLDSILPNLDALSLKAVGYEDINEIETVKFISIDDDNDTKTEATLWAFLENYGDVADWTPVRFEVKQFDDKVGSLDTHTVTDYFEFYFFYAKEDSKVFDIDQYDCSFQKHDANSEAITSSLLFIDPEYQPHVDYVFNSFKNKFLRKYDAELEHDFRRSLFQKSMRLVSSVNRQNLNYKLAINQFADRTPEEMRQHTGLLQRPHGKSGNIPFPYTEATLNDKAAELPKEYDLRLHGLVTPIKDQGSCGSCWTFGTTVAVEGAYARAQGGRPMSLSNQALIDCAWEGARGCNGGSDNAAYEWMMMHGLPTTEEYGSYANNDGYCNIKNMTKLYSIKGYTDVTPNNTDALKLAVVNHGPLSVSVEVTDAFKLYSTGIYYEAGCGPNNVNHEVALVGYSEEGGEVFWILKNSWGTSWGIDGYMHIAARDNNCGVETEPTYVTVA